MIKTTYFFYVLTLLFLYSCGGVSVIKKGQQEVTNESAIYSSDFLKKINTIKAEYKKGKTQESLEKLKSFDESKLTPIEIASKRNLMGVILFSTQKFEQAILQFELAQTTASKDPSLLSQVKLNLASGLYKIGQKEKSFNLLQEIDITKLTVEESKKHSKLQIRLAKELDKPSVEINALSQLLSGKASFSEIKNDPAILQLRLLISKMTIRERFVYLDELTNKDKLLAGLLGLEELEKSYYDPSRGDLKDLLNWLENELSEISEVKITVDTFKARLENKGKVDGLGIGLILPLSGKKKIFAERALYGLDSAKNEFIKKNQDAEEFVFHIKDTEGAPAVGQFKVKELVEKDHVSIIIGGLFPDEATKEYLEAKKHGVFFISLSQVYLPKEEKDHLLIEIPGSIESQMERLFSSELIEKFGKRAAIMAPDDPMGKAYLGEFWRKAQSAGVQVTGVHKFDKTLTDFRDPVKEVLGMRFPRERQEEYDILSNRYKKEKNSNVRRVSILTPQVDFDWIFIPAFPKEAMQIVPIFAYFDAVKLNFVGGPSWRSQALAKEAQKWGQVFFIGDDVDPEDPKDKDFLSSFTGLFGKAPKLIEMNAYDAFGVAKTILREGKINSKSDLESFIRSKGKLTGLTGEWNLQNGVWIKSMTAFKIKKGLVEKF